MAQDTTTIDLQSMTTAEMQEAVKAGAVDFAAVMAELDRRSAVKEQELTAAKAAAKASNGRTIKANNAGGLFVRDPAFKCWSADKSKEYTGCLNCDPDLMRALVNNEELLADIRAFLKTSGLTKFPVAKTTAQPTDNGNSGAQVANSLVSTNPPLAGRTKK